MTSEDQKVLNALFRENFASFVHRCVRSLNPGTQYLPNWHIDAIAYELERVRRGEITRLIINLPPRYLKSLMVSVAFPAFLLGHEPSHHRDQLWCRSCTQACCRFSCDRRIAVVSTRLSANADQACAR